MEKTSGVIRAILKYSWGEYIPELLFENKEILERIKNHPMALWKKR